MNGNDTFLFVFVSFGQSGSIRNWFVRWVAGSSAQSTDHDFDYCSDDEDEEEKDREEKKTIKERLQTIQEVSQSVQNTIGHIASLGESVKKYEQFSIYLLLTTYILHTISNNNI